jgi:hypothetical protein
MRTHPLCFLVLFLPLAILAAQGSRIPKEAQVGYQSISPNDLSARLHFIASPELEGREATFRGQKVAARYIASEFQRLGLKPIGDGGSYFQHFPVVVTRPSERSNIIIANKQGAKTFMFRKDYVSLSAQDTVLSGPVVFIGYMDAEPDSMLLKGKIVMALAGRREDAHDPSVPAMRRLQLFRQFPGSVATFVVADDTGSASIKILTSRFANVLDKGLMRPLGIEARGGFMFQSPILITPQVADEILAETGRSVSEMRRVAAQDTGFAPVVLSQTQVKIESQVSKEMKETENVVGLLEGSDPKLRDQVVVFSAHYDHLGISNEGTVFTGADDDGSGTVTVLELAEAFVTNPIKPKRSLLFITVTGEEKGLWGSQYYVTHPLIPLDRTVADLNTDMIGRVDTTYERLKNPNYVYVIGSDKISTELDSLLRLSNKASENLILDYKYNSDKDPEMFYRRSDHYNFARNGVPIAFFFTGVHKDYHRPTDTVDKILFDRMTKIVRLIYYTGWNVANFKTKLVKNVESKEYSK